MAALRVDDFLTPIMWSEADTLLYYQRHLDEADREVERATLVLDAARERRDGLATMLDGLRDAFAKRGPG